jgi:guanylate kinase
MIQAGEFAEWAKVHEHLYGTAKQEIIAKAEANDYVVFEVDCQGAASLRTSFPEAVSIFVLPPSMSVLKGRLTGRGTEAEHSLQVRLNNARGEIARAGEFDYCVVNDRLDLAVERVRAILTAAMHRSDRFYSKINDLLTEEV